MLSNLEITRYSRQIILNDFGINGQLKLKNGSALVVGCGGLGCPVAIYLASSGVGKIGLLDHDIIELSNLHRQVLHSQENIGISKCFSLLQACMRVNDSINYQMHDVILNSHNALDILKSYDVIVDATDNLPTRYLLSDACVLLNKPLVSGSALGFEGQLTVYNFEDAPCYRCMHPIPPPPETIANCSDAGIIPPVAGTIGTLQALEVIKILAGLKPSYLKKLFIFHGLYGETICVQIRSKQDSCISCGPNKTINSLIDYEQFCNAKATDQAANLSILDDSMRLTVEEYKHMLDEGIDHVLIDIRPPVELDICKLASTSHNITLSDIKKSEMIEKIRNSSMKKHIVVVCRRGNDSQLAVEILRNKIFQDGDDNHENKQAIQNKYFIKDIKGGLHAWTKNIDSNFPMY